MAKHKYDVVRVIEGYDKPKLLPYTDARVTDAFYTWLASTYHQEDWALVDGLVRDLLRHIRRQLIGYPNWTEIVDAAEYYRYSGK